MGRSTSPSNEVTISAWERRRRPPHGNAGRRRASILRELAGSENYNTIIERKKALTGHGRRYSDGAAGVLKYSDTGLEPNTRYFYRVRKSLGRVFPVNRSRMRPA